MNIKNISAFSIGTLLLVLLLIYMITYIVNYDETVVVTTFGASNSQSVKNIDGNQSGIFFKIPWPVQNIVRFDRRISVIEDRLEQQETKDKQVVILKAFLTWRISDPLKFYRTFRSTNRASTFLLERLRASKAEIGAFTFEDLTNANPDLVRLDDVNRALQIRIHRDLSSYETGIEVLSVGINRILLPENITRSVFQRMKQTRQRQAQNSRSEGNAIAQSIIAKTDSDKKRIMAFTERMSQRLMAEGDAAAARYYKEYSKSPEFAIFLRKLDAFKLSLSNNTTFIMDTDSEPFDLLESTK